MGETRSGPPPDPKGQTRPSKARASTVPPSKPKVSTTRKVQPQDASRPGANTGASSQRGRKRGFPYILLIPVYFFIVMAVAVVAGYSAGLSRRQTEQNRQLSQVAQEQFDLGIQDLIEGRYELARQRFEYVLSIDPSNADAMELLDRALVAMNQPTITPSPLPTDTPQVKPTATLSLDTLEGLFQAAQGALANEEWDAVMDFLIDLRGQEPTYRLAEVNQMMFTALRNRGLQKIFAGRLEPGIFDLTLAERFGSLDSQAASWKRSAEFYLFANSYYGLDPALASQYFGQICQANVWSACTKYAVSLMEYGDALIRTAQPCEAVVQYQASLNVSNNSKLWPTATEAAVACMTATASPPTETPTIQVTGTVTATPTVTATGLPGATSTPSATPSPTLSTPTETPTPTSTLTPTDTPGAGS